MPELENICSASLCTELPVPHYAITPLPWPTLELGSMNVGAFHDPSVFLHPCRRVECSSASGGSFCWAEISAPRHTKIQ